MRTELAGSFAKSIIDLHVTLPSKRMTQSIRPFFFRAKRFPLIFEHSENLRLPTAAFEHALSCPRYLSSPVSRTKALRSAIDPRACTPSNASKDAQIRPFFFLTQRVIYGRHRAFTSRSRNIVV